MSERESREPRPRRTKSHDFEHAYRGYWRDGGICRIRIYQAEGETPVVVATELPENTNTSITNMCEYLAAEIISSCFPERFEEEDPILWVEQYPRQNEQMSLPEFSIATFERHTPTITYLGGQKRVTIGLPTWTFISREQLAQLVELDADILET